jgi:energy-coupling factor transport system ATP-binding protein
VPIVIEHLTHTYQPGTPFQSVAVHDVSLAIDDKDLLALIGHTGSGKSTLAQHLNGLLKPTAGRVLVDGEDINARGADRRSIRRKVGLVFQYPEHQLFEETIARDIAFGPKNLGVSQAEVDERVREAMERVGLPYDELAEKSPFEISGGQMRRVALAGVLAMRPKVLVLDEPAAGLDPRGRDELLDTIAQLHGSGTAVVMISHSMDDVARLATRIAVMENGALALDGTPREVFTGHYDRLVAMGLDVPHALSLSRRLKGICVDIPECYLLPELTDALEVALKGGAAHAV